MVDPVDGQYLHHHFPSDQVVGVKQVCHLVNAIISKNSFYLYYSNVKINPLSWIRFFPIFSIKSWSNFKIMDSFVISAVQNCPWFWNLTKIWWRNWGKTRPNWVDWFWSYCITKSSKSGVTRFDRTQIETSQGSYITLQLAVLMDNSVYLTFCSMELCLLKEKNKLTQ